MDKKRPAIFEFDNFSTATETKHIYMHTFAGRSLTKITRFRVLKLNMYTLSNKKKHKRFNFLSNQYNGVADYRIVI